jgi:hypothetical protein
MAFLQPILCVQPSADLKSYTLEATVLARDGCYVAGGVAAGWPPYVSGTPEMEPVQLLVARRKGPCSESLQPLSFVKQGMPLSAGRTSLAAYVMLDDANGDNAEPAIVGVASMAIPRPEDATRLKLEPASAAKSGAWIGSGEVSGWIDRLPGPGSSPTAHVRVGMWAPTPGYKFQLKSIGPLGSSGMILLCEMKATRPSGTLPDLLSHKVVAHDGPLGPKQSYTSVAVTFEDKLRIGPITTVS